MESSEPDGEGVIQISLAIAEESIQQRAGPLRQARRRPLRHHQRLHQIAAGLRCRCGAVLAGAHGGGRREPTLHLPEDADCSGRRHRPGRPLGNCGGGSLCRGLRTSGPAGGVCIPWPKPPFIWQALKKATAFWASLMPSKPCAMRKNRTCPAILRDANRDGAAFGDGAGLPLPPRLRRALGGAAIPPHTPCKGRCSGSPDQLGWEGATARTDGGPPGGPTRRGRRTGGRPTPPAPAAGPSAPAWTAGCSANSGRRGSGCSACANGSGGTSPGPAEIGCCYWGMRSLIWALDPLRRRPGRGDV